MERFSIGATVGGWEVIDSDGRSVTDTYRADARAAEVALRLNTAASTSPAALRRAFGVVIDEDDSAYMGDEFYLGNELEVLSHE